ncbi:NAD(P)H-dependent flavin oxidoreductase [Nocardioides sp. URHA0020]|uniref:NAD(P)H-dependent flavin oxidoreductase n=1 Tax=Nocardioides sp. URHA0020 TaxID=1380392 RepID=UPI00048CC3A4|nr:nitronate monooxygenase [Nocardioides sp. URHA0020]
MNDVFDLRDLALPVISSPMAGGPSTPALAAAVSEAGGLGFLAAGSTAPEAVAADINAARVDTTGPLGVNLFVVDAYEPNPVLLDSYRRSLQPEATRLQVALGEPQWEDDHWQAKLDLVLDLRPDMVSFTFGCPADDVFDALAHRGILSCVTVSSLDEATAAVARGAGSLCIQGHEAGGHRATWDADASPSTSPLMTLVSAIASSVDVPVVAAGGIVDTSTSRALMDRGAVAVQAGTAYLLTDEAGTNATHRAALVDPNFTRTTLTRAFTGRWARGLENRFIAEHADAPAGYPHLHHVTFPLRQAAIAAGDMEVAHLWAGTGHSHVRSGAAADVTRALAP